MPDAKSNFRPDPNARTAKDLAWHIANTDVHFLDGIADLKFDMAEPGTSRRLSEVVAWYDENMKRGIGAGGRDDGRAIDDAGRFFGVFNMPAVLYLGFLNNHSIHHRGELATYLRPMGSKVPSIYGGSYDEPFNPPQHSRDRSIASSHISRSKPPGPGGFFFGIFVHILNILRTLFSILYFPHQRTFTGYLVKVRSAVSMVMSSTMACAMRMRSKGSP